MAIINNIEFIANYISIMRQSSLSVGHIFKKDALISKAGLIALGIFGHIYQQINIAAHHIYIYRIHACHGAIMQRGNINVPAIT